MEKHTVKIHFSNRKDAEYFITFMDAIGEEKFWNWMKDFVWNKKEISTKIACFEFNDKKLTITDVDCLD